MAELLLLMGVVEAEFVAAVMSARVLLVLVAMAVAVVSPFGLEEGVVFVVAVEGLVLKKECG